jgi:uncharacterized protein
MEWYNFKRQKLYASIHEVVENAIIKELNEGHRLKICIGCDSQVKGKIVDFATVVLILREKREDLCTSRYNAKCKPCPSKSA